VLFLWAPVVDNYHAKERVRELQPAKPTRQVNQSFSSTNAKSNSNIDPMATKNNSNYSYNNTKKEQLGSTSHDTGVESTTHNNDSVADKAARLDSLLSMTTTLLSDDET
jgi:hypothetical protein